MRLGSRKKEAQAPQNQIQDILRSKKNGILVLRKNYWEFRVDPEKVKALFSRSKGFMGYGIVALLVVAIVTVSFHARANIATFYSSSCLGGWKHPKNAEGAPENPHTFSEYTSNSAVYTNQNADLYCAGFTGEFPDSKVPQKFSLELFIDSYTTKELNALKAKEKIHEEKIEPSVGNTLDTHDTPLSIDGIIEDEVSVDSVPLKIIDTENIVESGEGEQTIQDTQNETSVVEKQADQTETTSESETTSNPEPVSDNVSVGFWSRAVAKIHWKQALAEDVPVDVLENSETTPPSTDTAVELEKNETVPNNPTVSIPEKNLIEDTQTTTVDQETKEESITEKSNEDENRVLSQDDTDPQTNQNISTNISDEDISEAYFKVAYSLDGESWIDLGAISQRSLPHPEFDLPFEELNTWQDVSAMQIRITPVQSFDTKPVFFLDAMAINVEYDELEALQNPPTIQIFDATVSVQGNNDFTLEDIPTFVLNEPSPDLDEVKKLIEQNKALVIEDTTGLLGEKIQKEPIQNESIAPAVYTQEMSLSPLQEKIVNVKEKLLPKFLKKDSSATVESVLIDVPEVINVETLSTDTTYDPPESSVPVRENIDVHKNENEDTLETNNEEDMDSVDTSSSTTETINEVSWKSVKDFFVHTANAEDEEESTEPSPEPTAEQKILADEQTVLEPPTETPEIPVENFLTEQDDSVVDEAQPETTTQTVLDKHSDEILEENITRDISMDVVPSDDQSVQEESDQEIIEDETAPLDSTTIEVLKTIAHPKNISFVLIDPVGREVDLPMYFHKVLVQGSEKKQITFDRPTGKILPGKYTLRTTFETPQAIVILNREFTWGVLTINTDRSIYTTSHDDAYIQMGVLNDSGHTICDADMVLSVQTPEGVIQSFTTDNGSITRSPQCGPDNVIDVPDYYAYYDIFEEVGEYTMTLTATTVNGTRTIEDSFFVEANPLFDVHRESATRIYPPAWYAMQLSITARDAWEGTITEKVPEDFQTRELLGFIAYSSVSTLGSEKELRWSVSMEAGETVQIGYEYKAPPISPELFLLGPLSFDDIYGSEVFTEKRQWQIASDAVANNGTIVYADYSGTYSDELNARTYTDPTTVGSQYTTVNTSDTNGIVWTKILASPTREEKIAAQMNATGILKILKCTTGCDATGDWSEIASYDSIVVGAGATSVRPYDIAYEQLSGLFTIVFAQVSNGGDVYYCQYDGSSWSPATVCGSTFAPGAANEIDMDGVGVTGQPEWIRLVARGDRLTSDRTDELMLGVSGSADDLFLAHWNGSAWEDEANPTDTLSSQNVQKFDIAFEGTTNDALAVVTDNSTGNLKYVEYTSGAWGSIQTSGEANNGGQAFNGWVNIEADPLSDDIAVLVADSGGDVEFFYWNGSTMDDQDATDDVAVENIAGEHMQVKWTRFTSMAVFMYTDSNTLTSDMQCWETGGGNFSAIIADVGSPNISNTDDIDDSTLTASPNNNRMIMTRRGAELVSGTGDTLVGLTFDGIACGDQNWKTLGTLVAGGAANGVEGGTNGNTRNKAHGSVYTPYTPWSLNWRFFDDETANDPSTGLNGAGENTTPTNVDAEEFIRLRMNIAERGGMGQTDSRKILQYADSNSGSCTPDTVEHDTDCTWSSVGDTGDTGAVWRYATSGETCASCTDGNTSNTPRLTSTTTGDPEVFYVSDKDASQDTDFDIDALTVKEIDFPLKAENVSGGTTYYFRIFEPRISSSGQDSVIFREQDDDGNNDCASATCTYPSLTTTSTGGLTVSGTAYQNNRTTALGSGKTVYLRVNGTLAGTGDGGTGIDDTDGSGNWSFSSVTASAGDTITLYLYNETEKANTVTITDGSTNITGASLYDDHLVIRSDNGSTATTILDLLDYDNDADASNMIFDAIDTTTDSLLLETGNALFINGGDSFTPGGTIITPSSSSSGTVAGDVVIDTSGDLTMSTYALTVGGDFLNQGTFTASSGQTTTFTATSTGHTITDGGNDFRIVVFNGVGGGWSLADSSTIVVTMTVTNGTFTPAFDLHTGPVSIGASGVLSLGSTTMTLTGTTGTPLTNSGTFTAGTSTVVYEGANASGNTTVAHSDSGSNVVYYSLTIDGSDTYVLNGYTNGSVSGVLTINNGTLDTVSNAISIGKIIIANSGSAGLVANASRIELNATSGDLFTRGASGFFTEGTSRVSLTGNGNAMVNNGTVTFYDLTSDSTGIKTVSSVGITITHELEVDDGTFTPETNTTTIGGSGTNTLYVRNDAFLIVLGNTYDAFADNYASFETVSLEDNSTVDYAKPGNQEIESSFTYVNLKGSGSSLKLLEGNVTATGTVSMVDTAKLDTDSSGSFSLNAGNILLSDSSEFIAYNSTITVSGNWTNNSTFTAGTSRVTFNTGTSTTISGATVFYDLTLTHTTTKNVTFTTSGSPVYEVQGLFSVAGSGSGNIIIRSDVPATQFNFLTSGTVSNSYEDVKDGGCESGAVQMYPTNSVDSGNNDSCWFDTNYTISFSLGSTSLALGTLSFLGEVFGSHTLSVVSTAPGGFSISLYGTDMQHGADIIDPFGAANPSTPGTEEFGLNARDNTTPDVGANVVVNSGSCDYGGQFGTVDKFAYGSYTDIPFASSSGSGDCVYTASYVTNISDFTASGNYQSTVTYTVTGTF